MRAALKKTRRCLAVAFLCGVPRERVEPQAAGGGNEPCDFGAGLGAGLPTGCGDERADLLHHGPLQGAAGPAAFQPQAVVRRDCRLWIVDIQ